MYQFFFGLTQYPFRLSCQPELMLLTQQHQEAAAGLTYAMLRGQGISVLTGNAGTGKTTLINRVLQYIPEGKFRTSVISNTTLSCSEFLEMLMLDFGVRPVPASKAQRLEMLEEFLVAQKRAGISCVVAVDEAQRLSPDVLEEIRLLSNLEMDSNVLLQIVLIGQPELDEVLNRHDLRQFKQRIGIRLHLQRLADQAVCPYIQHRWSHCGGAVQPFTPEAIAEVARVSAGIPRIINTICDNALLNAFAAGSKVVDRTHVIEACTDLRFATASRAPSEAVARDRSLAGVTSIAPVQTTGTAVIEGSAAPLANDHPLPTLQRQMSRNGALSRWAGRLGLVTDKA